MDEKSGKPNSWYTGRKFLNTFPGEKEILERRADAVRYEMAKQLCYLGEFFDIEMGATEKANTLAATGDMLSELNDADLHAVYELVRALRLTEPKVEQVEGATETYKNYWLLTVGVKGE